MCIFTCAMENAWSRVVHSSSTHSWCAVISRSQSRRTGLGRSTSQTLAKGGSTWSGRSLSWYVQVHVYVCACACAPCNHVMSFSVQCREKVALLALTHSFPFLAYALLLFPSHTPHCNHLPPPSPPPSPSFPLTHSPLQPSPSSLPTSLTLISPHTFPTATVSLPPPSPWQCVELFSSMVGKTHSVETVQYVLTQLADLTQDEKTTVQLVKVAKGSVPVHYSWIPWHMR